MKRYLPGFIVFTLAALTITVFALTRPNDSASGDNNNGNQDLKDKPARDKPQEQDLSKERTDTEALALVEKAIKAHGGSAGLTRSQRMVRTMSGTMELVGQGSTSFEDTLTTDFPHRFRFHLRAGENKSEIVVVFAKDRGWMKDPSGTTEMSPGDLEENGLVGHAFYLASLVPLVKEKGYILKKHDDVEVNGKPAAGVRILSASRDPILFHFDKTSGLLVRISFRVRQRGLIADKVLTFGEHKEFGGVQLPTVIAENFEDKPYMKAKDATYRFLDKMDDSQFGQP